MTDSRYPKLSRRSVVKGGTALAAGAAVAPALGAAATAAQTGDPAEVPRERTLILRWGGQEGRYIDAELWNGYLIASSHQNGLGIFHEPLAFYSAFADETIPWLAEKWEYNADSTQLTITTRSGITWSDGQPFSAEDVAYTIQTLTTLGAEVKWSTVAPTSGAVATGARPAPRHRATAPRPPRPVVGPGMGVGERPLLSCGLWIEAIASSPLPSPLPDLGEGWRLPAARLAPVPGTRQRVH